MSVTLLILAMAATSEPAMPTAGLLTIENLDCVSRQLSSDQAQTYFAMARKGQEAEALQSVEKLVKECQIRHGWTDKQSRNAFRVAVMDGWLLQEGLLEKIAHLGNFRPFLDQYYAENVKPTGRHILEDVFASGQLDKDLTAAGYPEDRESRELAYNYWEWRGALWDIEEDFRNGEIRQ